MEQATLGLRKATLKTEKERVRSGDQHLDGDLLDFWGWITSDILSNATRGVLAEHIVAQAVGINTKEEVRDEAPQWNIVAVWIGSILLTARVMYGVLFQRIQKCRPSLSSEDLLGAMPKLLGIVIVSLGWATVWTKYFKESVRVRNTFYQKVSDTK